MRRAYSQPCESRLQLIDRSMYALQKPRFLQHDSTLSTCQVCEEFLQGYHELLQRVSNARNSLQTANQNPSLLIVMISKWKKKVYRTKEMIRIPSESDSGMQLSRIFVFSGVLKNFILNIFIRYSLKKKSLLYVKSNIIIVFSDYKIILFLKRNNF